MGIAVEKVVFSPRLSRRRRLFSPRVIFSELSLFYRCSTSQLNVTYTPQITLCFNFIIGLTQCLLFSQVDRYSLFFFIS